MTYPKNFSSKDGVLSFLQIPYLSGLHYLSNPSLPNSYHVKFSYTPLAKLLEINGINSGTGSLKIPGLTRKVLQSTMDVFDMSAIRFVEVIESDTLAVLAQSSLSSGQVIGIPNYQNSAFLRVPKSLGFVNFETNYFDRDVHESCNLLVYK